MDLEDQTVMQSPDQYLDSLRKCRNSIPALYVYQELARTPSLAAVKLTLGAFLRSNSEYQRPAYNLTHTTSKVFNRCLGTCSANQEQERTIEGSKSSVTNLLGGVVPDFCYLARAHCLLRGGCELIAMPLPRCKSAHGRQSQSCSYSIARHEQ